MNKIVLNFGLLIFFLSILIFSEKGLVWNIVLLRAFIIFMVVTVMGSIFAMSFVKAINKRSLSKGNILNDKLLGRNKHE